MANYNRVSANYTVLPTDSYVGYATLSAPRTVSLQLAAGNRLSADFAGVLTSLAGVQVTVALQPI